MIKTETLQDFFGATPRLVIDRDAFGVALHRVLSRLTLIEFAQLITNEFTEVVEYTKLMRDQSACQKTSLLFNPHRLATRCKGSISVYGALQQVKFCDGLARALIWKEGKVAELLYQTIQLGINGVDYVGEFPPTLCRELLQSVGCGAGSRVLDPCSGWGGRMIGVSSIGAHYLGFEPSTVTHAGLVELYGFLQMVNQQFQADVHCLPYEDSNTDGSFDAAITSPPYYDTEEYSTEQTNSLVKYLNFNDWLAGFFYPLIDLTMARLRDGGTFILNVGNRKYPLDKLAVEHCAGRFEVSEAGNKLSGQSGLRTAGKGERFLMIKKTGR